MKFSSSSRKAILGACVFFAAAAAQAGQMYKIKITNGGEMPISPGALYVSDSADSLALIGQAPTSGIVHLCQMGNPADRINEVQAASGVASVQQTQGLILPGQSIEVSVNVANPAMQSIHFEAMYGMTKDTCAQFSISAGQLKNLTPGEVLTGQDRVVAAGAFMDPTVPAANTPDVCENLTGAVDCLRALAMPNKGMSQLHYFNGYLPSVVNYIEQRYGASATQALLIPGAGGVKFTIYRD